MSEEILPEVGDVVIFEFIVPFGYKYGGACAARRGRIDKVFRGKDGKVRVRIQSPKTTAGYGAFDEVRDENDNPVWSRMAPDIYRFYRDADEVCVIGGKKDMMAEV